MFHSFNPQDTSEKLQTKTYVWANKDDPDLYGTWDFEVRCLKLVQSFIYMDLWIMTCLYWYVYINALLQEWKQLHMEGFLKMTKEFAEEMNLPGSET